MTGELYTAVVAAHAQEAIKRGYRLSASNLSLAESPYFWQVRKTSQSDMMRLTSLFGVMIVNGLFMPKTKLISGQTSRKPTPKLIFS